MTKEVLITMEYYKGYDEFCTHSFKCPECSGLVIGHDISYCSHCGVKVKFTTKVLKAYEINHF